ncbi:hypothetical protein B9G39_13105 [Zooshikella ganghwensis]|uniref:Uncharacterized protein n=1 Tax=Zooshikella ganghwensis TaxID=202772 RepID=A0A4P9VN28_9GAMM|nr:hypothetical protein B9G39_13105 [Zooshikella ganghwensis]
MYDISLANIILLCIIRLVAEGKQPSKAADLVTKLKSEENVCKDKLFRQKSLVALKRFDSFV